MLIKHWVDDYNARHRICDENHRESKEGHLNKSHEYSEFLQKMNALNIHQIEQLLTLDESSCSIFLVRVILRNSNPRMTYACIHIRRNVNQSLSK